MSAIKRKRDDTEEGEETEAKSAKADELSSTRTGRVRKKSTKLLEMEEGEMALASYESRNKTKKKGKNMDSVKKSSTATKFKQTEDTELGSPSSVSTGRSLALQDTNLNIKTEIPDIHLQVKMEANEQAENHSGLKLKISRTGEEEDSMYFIEDAAEDDEDAEESDELTSDDEDDDDDDDDEIDDSLTVDDDIEEFDEEDDEMDDNDDYENELDVSTGAEATVLQRSSQALMNVLSNAPGPSTSMVKIEANGSLKEEMGPVYSNTQEMALKVKTSAERKAAKSKKKCELPPTVTKTVDQSLPFICDKCGQHYAYKSSLVRHMVLVHDSSNCKFICTVCQKGFTCESALQTHQATHSRSEENKLHCDHCTRTFHSSWGLIAHQKSKHPEVYKKGHECPFCKQIFGQKGHLKEHMVIHTPEEPKSQCVKCGRSFRHLRGLRYHQKNCTGVWVDKRGRPKVTKNKCNFTCEICGKIFSRETYLSQHMYMHQEPRYSCAACHTKFRWRKGYLRHIHNCDAMRGGPVRPVTLMAKENIQNSTDDSLSNSASTSVIPVLSGELSSTPFRNIGITEQAVSGSNPENTPTTSKPANSLIELGEKKKKKISFTPVLGEKEKNSSDSNQSDYDIKKDNVLLSNMSDDSVSSISSKGTLAVASELSSVADMIAESSFDLHLDKDLFGEELLHGRQSAKYVYDTSPSTSDISTEIFGSMSFTDIGEGANSAANSESLMDIYDQSPFSFQPKTTEIQQEPEFELAEITPVESGAYASSTVTRRTEDVKKFGCVTCGKMFKRSWHLREHAVIHQEASESQVLNCGKCKKQFRHRRSLQRHKLTCQDPAEKEPREFICEKCGQTFSSSSNLGQHMNKHDDKMHPCKECNKKFRWNQSRLRHEKQCFQT